MNIEPRADERASIELRALYRSFGYSPYKVRKFEEYDLYSRYRSFLESERILTFSDTDGRLMAMRPDVTLSIVKNTREEDGTVKVCYAERVYRVPRGGEGFSEIMQAGVECIGAVDAYAMGEVVMLAARSLALIGGRYALDVSDMGVVAGVLAGEVLDAGERRALLALIREKNRHGLEDACARFGMSAEAGRQLLALVGLYGPMADVLPELERLGLPPACDGALENLRAVERLTRAYDLEHINLDFSVVNDLGYYNGIIMNGFVDGVPACVLSGGRYDPLLRRMGRKGEGIGFAVYLDLIERYLQKDDAFGVDVLITCDERTDPAELARVADELTRAGQSVRVQRGEPAGIAWRRHIRMEGGGRA